MQALRTKTAFLQRFMSSKPDVASCALPVMELRRGQVKVFAKYFWFAKYFLFMHLFSSPHIQFTQREITLQVFGVCFLRGLRVLSV